MPAIIKQEQIPAQNGKHVTKITVETGAVGILASDVPVEALKGLERKLRRRLASLEKKAVAAKEYPDSHGQLVEINEQSVVTVLKEI